MRENRAQALDYVFSDEGGYAVRPDGGMVNFGITYETLVDWCRRHGLQLPMYGALRKLTRDDAAEIYTADYIDRIDFDGLVSGVDYAILDTAVNLGVGGTVETLQAYWGLLPTRKFDAPTVAAINALVPDVAIATVRDLWITHKRAQPLYKVHAEGWEARDLRVRQRALAMVRKTPN